ncbi:MAG: ATP-binding protein [Thermodesulfobacteriota bacterium]
MTISPAHLPKAFASIFDDPERSRACFFAVLESMPYGIVLADNASRLQYISLKARRLLGLAGSSISCSTCFDLLRRCPGVTEEAIAVLRTTGGRCTVRCRDGEQPEGRVVILARQELQSPFLELAGYFILTLTDVTYQEISDSQQERNRRYAAMQEMALQMNQDLKNPLGSIELCASMLRREVEGDPASTRLADQIMQAVRCMDVQLHNYRTYASLPSPRFAPVEIKGWLKQAIADLVAMDGEHLYTFRLVAELGQQQIQADADMLRLLAVNAGRNCMESMASGGEIVVRVRLMADCGLGQSCCEIRFEDRGTGIPAAQMDKIFDPFFTTKNRANGMGLPIIHFIAERHGGMVQVENREGGGTVLTVLLPLMAAVS